jgi:hypothetical protein
MRIMRSQRDAFSRFRAAAALVAGDPERTEVAAKDYARHPMNAE